jgi:hypothetical protein
MAEIIDIADAVVTELNATTFSAPYDSSVAALRSYLPQYDLKDMDTLHVTVVPKGVVVASDVSSRAHQQHDYQIDVAVQKKPALSSDGSLDNDALDALSVLVEEIADHFRAGAGTGRLPGRTPVMCQGVEYVAVYDPESLQKFTQFTSLLTFTFRRMR